MALISIRFLLSLTDGATSLSSTDRASVAHLPYSLPLLYRGYLTASTHTIYATLPVGREATGLAPLLTHLAFGGVSSTTGLLPLWAHAPAPPPPPNSTNPYRLTFHIPILTASTLNVDLPNTTAPLIYQNLRRHHPPFSNIPNHTASLSASA
jgi:hypothetical protein